ncbi:hypothetical protein [Salinicoccus sp. HZC-1]|uniref:hypothetical protein n=1 Tax=Salinicoccus sp. HZC-1 TaxID=3385497 RepID=UPI00398A7420
MKKSLFSIFIFSLLFLMGCNNSNDLSGKTFDLAYPPGPLTEGDELEDQNVFMTLSFDNGKVTREDGNEIKGEYTLSEEALTITFKHDEEEFKVELDDFVKSEKEFSSYSAVVSDTMLEDPGEGLDHLIKLAHAFSDQLPIEFIEQ